MVCKWADDSQHFILEHFDAIQNSPSEVYHCVPFSPSSSWLRECYSSDLLQKVKVVKGLQTQWGACFRTVSFDNTPQTLACWNNLVAVSFDSYDIIILDAVTGANMSVLSKHTDWVRSLAFSSDGSFLVSGGNDWTVNLWDMQTGGVVKTFFGHTSFVLSVSISPDHITIASGSWDRTIQLWSTQTGECHCVIRRDSGFSSVSFSPVNSQLLMSASYDQTIQQWDIDGCQIGPVYKGKCSAFSSDGTCFVLWRGTVATIQNSDSGAVIAKLQVPSDDFQCCCFSPDSKSVAGIAGHTIYLWDITPSDPCLIKTFVGHTNRITSLVYSSSIISSSVDQSIKIWQIGTSSPGPIVTDSASIVTNSASIESVSLQVNDGIAMSSDLAGVVRVWDISTGLCKAAFQTPAVNYHIMEGDIQLVDARLIFAWCGRRGMYIWDGTKEREFLRVPLGVSASSQAGCLRISGDRSKIFLLRYGLIQAWSISTGEFVGEVRFKGVLDYHSLIVNGSKIWVYYEDSQTQGWDFGFPGTTPILLPDTSLDLNRPPLEFIDDIGPRRIKDVVTGKDVFQLPGKYANYCKIRWDGQYLVAGYSSGEVLILDFKYMIPQ